jgi:hypothetical protein
MRRPDHRRARRVAGHAGAADGGCGHGASVPPMPLAPVIISYPDTVGAGERHAGELTLFIDETGAVVRGELAEQGAVKSRIRIEVVFEGGAPLLIG